MAKTKDPNEEDQTANAPTGEAPTGSESSCEDVNKKTTESIDKYQEDVLKMEQSEANSQRKVKALSYREKKNLHRYKLCERLQADDSYDEYTKMKNCFATTLSKDIEMIQTGIDGYIAKSDKIKEALKNTASVINEANKKMEAVKEAACKFEAVYADTCNSGEVSKIIKGFNETGDTGDVFKNERWEEVSEQIESCHKKAINVFESSIKVAGIQSFANVKSLKDFANSVQTEVEGFASDVDGNITFSAEQMENSQKSLSESITAVSEADFLSQEAALLHESLGETNDYADNIDPDMKGKDTTREALEDICTSIEAIFVGDVPTGKECE